MHPRFPRLITIAAAFALVVLGLRGAPAAAETPVPTGPFVPGQVVLGLMPGASPSSTGIDPKLVRRVSHGYMTIAVPVRHEQEVATRLAGGPGIASAELNYIAQPMLIPNDPKFPQQWDMSMIQMPAAWDSSLGLGVTIGVVDTGVAFEDYGDFRRSPELSQATFVSPYNSMDGSAHPNDDNGHGTHVTGTLAQDFDDGVGVAGIAPLAQIMPVKVCDLAGCPDDAMADGITWAVDHGANVINMSLGGPTINQAERDALQYAEDRNVVVVAAAGNGGSDFIGDDSLDYPADVSTVIAVGSVNQTKDRVSYSNYNGADPTQHFQIMAPGGNNHQDLDNDGNPDGVLQNTYTSSCNGGTADFTTFTDCYFQGTSMATPHVTGTVALLLARYPTLKPPEVRKVLACSAQDIGPFGIDAEYGVGLVQTAAALHDTDGDGIPDCLQPRPQVLFSMGGANVEPGKKITLTVDALTNAPLSTYNVSIAYDHDVAKVVHCDVRTGATCQSIGPAVKITGRPAEPMNGSFRIASLTFQVGDTVPSSTSLQVTGSALSGDGLGLAAVVSAHDGLISVQNVPLTISGDVNCDFHVDAHDVAVAIAFSLELQHAFCSSYGDVNCNGVLDGLDALLILKFLAGLHPAVPTACPAIGV